MKRIVALIDGSEYSRSVCDHAAWISGRTGAGVEALHVLGRRQGVKPTSDLSGNIKLGARTALLEELAAHDETAGKLAQKKGRAILEDVHEILAQAGVADIATRLRIGDIVEAAAEAEAEADMVLIGKRGEASGDHAGGHLGSNFERIARTLTKPILSTPTAFKPIERVLIAHDGGASSLKAVDWIARSPLFEGLWLKVLTVAEDGPEARKRVEDARALLAGAGFEAEVDVIPGQPEPVIREALTRDRIDLLVMGAYSHTRLRTLFIGSTTTEMVRACPCPVLMFR